MSQALISASEKSVTVSKMVSMNKYVPFYQPSPACDALGVLYTKVSPSIPLSGTIKDQSITWVLPSAGFLLDASIGLNLTIATGAGNVLGQPVALDIIRNLEFISNGVPVINVSGVALKCQVLSLRDSSAQAFILRHATFLDKTNENPKTVAMADNEEFLTYIPMIQTFLSAPEKALLLNKTKLELRVTFNDTASSGVAGDLTLVNPGAILYLKSYMPKLSLYQEVVTNDWSKQFSMDLVNCYVEPITPSTVTTLAGYQITCPYPAIKTHFIVQRIQGALGSPNFKIHTISLNLGGVKFLDNMKTSRVISNESKYGMSKLALTTAGALSYHNDVLTIDWGLTGSRQGEYGVNFWSENQGSVVDLVFDTVTTAGDSRVFIVHEYLEIVDWVPGSGGRGFLQVTSNN